MLNIIILFLWVNNMENILKYLKVENINLKLQSKNKNQVIKEMCEFIKNNENILDISKCYDDILKRENIGSTQITEKIAIPHTKTNQVKDFVISLGVSKNGIDYGVEKIKLIILFLVPNDKHIEYLKLLATISRVFVNEKLVDNIINSNSSEDIIDYLKGCK